MNLPNLLTLLRILLIPVFVLVYLLDFTHANRWATLVFGLAAFTDWLDGWLARRLNLTSRLGAFLDPVADKLMVATAVVMLVMSNPNPWFTLAAMVIVGREITISALREWMAEVGQRAQVSVAWLGKLKTAAQMTALFLLIWEEPVPLLGWSGQWVGEWTLGLAAVLTLWSMVNYLRAAWPYLRE